jgi:predicted aldo/keto reductase-like oxidoreductase
MKENKIKRRDFLKISAKGTVVAAALPIINQACGPKEEEKSNYNAKGIPTRVFGRTKVSVPIIGIGGGTRFCTMTDPEVSTKLLTKALDQGFYYWDTARAYGNKYGVISEERYGMALKGRRNEVFLATKVKERSYDGVMRHLEESLKRLQTDHLDLYQVHNLKRMEEVDEIGKDNGAVKAMYKLRDEKVTDFLGFTGHTSAEVMQACINRFDFDTMLLALNHHKDVKGDFENQIIPLAAKKNIGVAVMKVIRPRETVENVTPEQLIRFALSLKHVSLAMIGMDSIDVMQNNVEIAKTFKPMITEEMEKMSATLKPFFKSHNLPWMQPGYEDGYLV